MMKSLKRRRAGFSLVELTVVISILSVLALGLVQASESMGQLTASGNTQAGLQREGDRAQRTILADLRWAGIRDLDGRRYPHIFDGPDSPSGFAEHSYDPAEQDALPGDPDFGLPHALVFVAPADIDADGRPDFDLNRNGIPELNQDGDDQFSESPADLVDWVAADNFIELETGLVWSRDEISYVVVTGVDGRNRLERRVNADPTSAQTVALDVERLEVESAEDTGFEIPTNALRIAVHFRKSDLIGTVYRYQIEFVVRLRNGELSL